MCVCWHVFVWLCVSGEMGVCGCVCVCMCVGFDMCVCFGNMYTVP